MFKTIGIVALLFTVISIAGFTSLLQHPVTPIPSSPRERIIQETVLSQLASFQDYLQVIFFAEAGKDEVDSQKIRQAFLQSRLRFKQFEWAAEYFAADLTKRLNGPPVQEIENADLLDPSLARGVPPTGLQVIEQLIYPAYDTATKKELLIEIGHLKKNTGYLIAYFTDHPLADWRILDAAKLEVFRIISLGVTGFDNALSSNSMEESAASLQSLRNVLCLYPQKNKDTSLLQQLDASIRYLHHHPAFEEFDRAAFITRFGNMISGAIAHLEQDLPGRKITYNRMLRQDVKTLFDSNAFNVEAFSPGPASHATDEKTLLGKKLFYDVSLSGTGTRSCASCHSPELAFTDGLARHKSIDDTSKLLLRNVPTLLNVALQSNYFYDMRSLTLEDQVCDVISSKHEMDGSMDAVILHVIAEKSYQALFANAFPGKTENGISANEISNAIACYVRSLTKLNSRFDLYMRGNDAVLSAQELNGFNLFTGKARCATCHFVPLFNGVTPPKFVASETEVIGVPVSITDSTLDPDPGYYGVIGVDAYKHAFKIPTVRNIKKTAPYMHNGVYQSLEQVMNFYNNGGAAGLKISLPNQTLSKENLGLTKNEQEAIIAFMKSLENVDSQ